MFEGNSSVLLNHMAFYHNFSVGQPNNLVFVHELIDLLEDHLNKNICIFCEKTFKTRDVLKEHMRKKAHKKINPKVGSKKTYSYKERPFNSTLSFPFPVAAEELL